MNTARGIGIVILFAVTFGFGVYFATLLSDANKPEPEQFNEIMLRVPKEPGLKLIQKQILLNKAQLTILLQLEEWEKKQMEKSQKR